MVMENVRLRIQPRNPLRLSPDHIEDVGIVLFEDGLRGSQAS